MKAIIVALLAAILLASVASRSYGTIRAASNPCAKCNSICPIITSKRAVNTPCTSWGVSPGVPLCSYQYVSQRDPSCAGYYTQCVSSCGGQDALEEEEEADNIASRAWNWVKQPANQQRLRNWGEKAVKTYDIWRQDEEVEADFRFKDLLKKVGGIAKEAGKAYLEKKYGLSFDNEEEEEEADRSIRFSTFVPHDPSRIPTRTFTSFRVKRDEDDEEEADRWYDRVGQGAKWLANRPDLIMKGIDFASKYIKDDADIEEADIAPALVWTVKNLPTIAKGVEYAAGKAGYAYGKWQSRRRDEEEEEEEADNRLGFRVGNIRPSRNRVGAISRD